MKLFGIPDTKDECLKIHGNTKGLNAFALLYDILGGLLALIVLIATFKGIDIMEQFSINAYIMMSLSTFNGLVGFVGIIVAALVFLRFHYKAVLLRAAGACVQNTYVSANIETFKMYNPNGETSSFGSLPKVENYQAPPAYVPPVQEPVKPVTPVQDNTQQFSIPQYDIPKDICPKCGSNVLPGDAFCINCGTKIK